MIEKWTTSIARKTLERIMNDKTVNFEIKLESTMAHHSSCFCFLPDNLVLVVNLQLLESVTRADLHVKRRAHADSHSDIIVLVRTFQAAHRIKLLLLF